jgi:hypothetical protein
MDDNINDTDDNVTDTEEPVLADIATDEPSGPVLSIPLLSFRGYPCPACRKTLTVRGSCSRVLKQATCVCGKTWDLVCPENPDGSFKQADIDELCGTEAFNLRRRYHLENPETYFLDDITGRWRNLQGERLVAT